jgi:DNA-directed RNA polymerase specialized sigma24 family protein
VEIFRDVRYFVDRRRRHSSTCSVTFNEALGTHMGSPSPSDLLWVIGYAPQVGWTLPIVRAAVRAEWPAAQRIAQSQLGDETLANEIMELAISQTHESLAEKVQATVDEARKILAVHYRNGVRRQKRIISKLVLRGTGSELDSNVSSQENFADKLEARLDVDKILRDTPSDVRHALLARYGARSRWDEVATELNKSSDSIRMASRRELERLRSTISISKNGSRSGCQ